LEGQRPLLPLLLEDGRLSPTPQHSCRHGAGANSGPTGLAWSFVRFKVKSLSTVKEIRVTNEYTSDVSVFATSAFFLLPWLLLREFAFYLLVFSFC
jgi:hypothetical protein